MADREGMQSHAFAFAFAVAVAVAVAVAFDLPGPLSAAGPAGEYPKGDAQDARRFSPAHGCAVEKCPPGLRTRSA
jgi:hypothetical protein